MSWQQVGNNIVGTSGQSYGYSISLSDDGQAIAVASIYSRNIKIYIWDGTGWIQKGGDIIAPYATVRYSVSLNYNGSIVAIGCPFISPTSPSSVAVYYYNNATNAWVIKGPIIYGYMTVVNDNVIYYSNFGYNISLNSSANNDDITIAISSEDTYIPIAFYNRRVTVYKYQASNNTWNSTGSDAFEYGSLCSLSSDGLKLAIAANNPPSIINDTVILYVWNGTNWIRRGGSIGTFRSGSIIAPITSLSLSKDGRVIGFGFRGDENFSNLPKYAIYSWNSNTFAWELRQYIVNEMPFDGAGISISLNHDGSSIAVGSYLYDIDGTGRGRIRVFDWVGTSYIQRSTPIDGQNIGDQFGYSVSISSDGNTVAAGAPYNDDGGNLSGHVRLFSENGLVSTTTTTTTTTTTLSPNGTTTTTTTLSPNGTTTTSTTTSTTTTEPPICKPSKDYRRIQLRRGLENDFITANTILASGEPAFCIDTNILKVGDGSHSWASLPSFLPDTVGSQVYAPVNNPNFTGTVSVNGIEVSLQGHFHIIDDVEGLQDQLDLKAYVNHNQSNIYEFTTSSKPSNASGSNGSYTWTVPQEAKIVRILLIGGGGGGGSGRRGASNTAKYGGGGGASGNVCDIIYSAQADGIAGQILTISVGSGGAGGASQTSNDSNGFSGTNGGTSSITWLGGLKTAIAAGGGGGNGGSNTSGAGGTIAFYSMMLGNSGGSSSVTANASTATLNGWGSAGYVYSTGGGGGGGGGISSTNISYNGGRSRGDNLIAGATLEFTDNFAPLTAGANGPDGADSSKYSGVSYAAGAGAGGNAGNSITAGGNGGNGGKYGGAGGGGGASFNNFNSGSGGNGGGGYIRIVVWY